MTANKLNQFYCIDRVQSAVTMSENEFCPQLSTTLNQTKPLHVISDHFNAYLEGFDCFNVLITQVKADHFHLFLSAAERWQQLRLCWASKMRHKHGQERPLRADRVPSPPEHKAAWEPLREAKRKIDGLCRWYSHRLFLCVLSRVALTFMQAVWGNS